MNQIYDEAANILIGARRDIGDRPELTKKQIENYRGGLARLLDVVYPQWKIVSPRSGDTNSRVIIELDQRLRAIHRDRPDLRTAVSRARSAIRKLGIDLPNGHGRRLESPAWDRYLCSGSKKAAGITLFASECSRQGIEPDGVNNGVISIYFQTAYAGRPRANALVAVRRIVEHLNNFPPLGTKTSLFLIPESIDNRRIRADLLPVINTEIADWWAYRLCGDRILKPVGPVTAARETKLLFYYVSAFSNAQSVGTIAKLLYKSKAKPVLEQEVKRSKERDPHDGWGAMAYEMSRVLLRIAKSDFLQSRGQPAVESGVSCVTNCANSQIGRRFKRCWTCLTASLTILF
jgi:hypothetical protein